MFCGSRQIFYFLLFWPKMAPLIVKVADPFIGYKVWSCSINNELGEMTLRAAGGMF